MMRVVCRQREPHGVEKLRGEQDHVLDGAPTPRFRNAIQYQHINSTSLKRQQVESIARAEAGVRDAFADESSIVQREAPPFHASQFFDVAGGTLDHVAKCFDVIGFHEPASLIFVDTVAQACGPGS